MTLQKASLGRARAVSTCCSSIIARRDTVFVTTVGEAVYCHFESSDHHIAQLEFAMILYGLKIRPAQFRNRRGLWFVDNTGALMSLIRGRSSSPDL